MQGFYYREGSHEGIIVPYLLIGKVENGKLGVCFHPDRLAGIVEGLRGQRDAVRENLLLGRWTEVDIGGEEISHLVSLCSDARYKEAGELALSFCRDIVEFARNKES